NLNGAPSKPGLKPPSDASASQVGKLGEGDQVKFKTSASAKAGETNAQTESSVAVKKNDQGKYEVSAERATATGVGLNVPKEPSSPGSTSSTTTQTQGTSERPGQPRGPIIETGPKPEQGPGPLGLPRPGGVVSLPGGPSILTG